MIGFNNHQRLLVNRFSERIPRRACWSEADLYASGVLVRPPEAGKPSRGGQALQRRASPPEAGKPRAQIYPPLADPAPRGCRVFNAQGHSFNIRPARISDAESICRVHRAAVKAIEGGLYEKRLVTGWADAVTEAVIRTGTAAADTVSFVAESDGVLVGFAALYKNTIAALHVHPDFQHNGVGSNLLNRLETVAAAKGLQSLKLNASKNSCPFHQAHGYRILRKAPFALDDTLTLESFEMTKYLV